MTPDGDRWLKSRAEAQRCNGWNRPGARRDPAPSLSFSRSLGLIAYECLRTGLKTVSVENKKVHNKRGEHVTKGERILKSLQNLEALENTSKAIASGGSSKSGESSKSVGGVHPVNQSKSTVVSRLQIWALRVS